MRSATPGTRVATTDAAATVAAIPTAEEIENMMDVPVDIPVVEPFVAPKLAKPPKPPKWDKIAPVDLEHTDEEAITAGNGRPRWMIPTGVATLALVLVGAVYSMTHRETTPPNTVRVGNSTVVPTSATPQPGYVPRGGFLTQSAGGAVTSAFAPNTPTITPDSVTGVVDSASQTPVLTQEQLDSIAEARAARARRAAAREQAAREAAAREAQREAEREAERRRIQAITDSLNSPASTWNTRPDTMIRPIIPPQPFIRPDTLVVRPDSIRPRPDTLVTRA